MSVAARAMAWGRRMRSLPGPMLGSGDQSTDQPLIVQAFIGGLWVDVTSDVRADPGVDITRGSAAEAIRPDPTDISFSLDNRDGKWSPRNPRSPYYGLIGRNTPFRVGVPYGAEGVSWRGCGEAGRLPTRWDPTGTDIYAPVQVSGILRRLAQGDPPTNSVLYRALAASTSAFPPVAYWPLEDGTNSTTVACVKGGGVGTILGTVALASGTSFIASDPLPNVDQGGFTLPVSKYTATGATQVRFLLAVPSTGATNGSVIARVATTGTYTWELKYGTGGGYQLWRVDSTGTATSVIGPIGASLDGNLYRISLDFTETGGNVAVRLSELHVGGAAGYNSATVSSATVGRVTSMSLTPNSLTGSIVGHVTLQLGVTDIFEFSDQLKAYNLEAASSRFSRLCVENNIPYVVNDRDSLNAAISGSMGPQTKLSLMDLIWEIVDFEGGVLAEMTDQIGLSYAGRVSRYNLPASLTLNYSTGQLAVVPEPVDDDLSVRNDVTVTRLNGSSANVVDDYSPVSVLPPPLGVSRYAESVQINVPTDDRLIREAGWRVHLGTADEPRYPSLAVNLASPHIDPVTRRQVLDVGPGKRVVVTNTPSWMPPGGISQHAVGFVEHIDHFEHRVGFNCSPESVWRVGYVEDSTYGWVDTDGSVLAGPVTAGAASITVSPTTAGDAGWSTSASDYPVDIMVSGAHLTVTAVSALASNVQTFTVTWGANGISKNLVAGADVRLANPTIVAPY